MKKAKSLTVLAIVSAMILSGCASAAAPEAVPAVQPETADDKNIVSIAPNEDITVETPADLTAGTPVRPEDDTTGKDNAEDEVSVSADETADTGESISGAGDVTAEETDADAAGKKGSMNGNVKTASKAVANARPIVWIGDSLTQGSLGHDGDNLAGAPYEKLKTLVGVPVEGFGLYGYTAHDIFWAFTDPGHLNQTIDPTKTYILWVGSNDWASGGVANTDTAPVIAEIDRFLSLEGKVANYIVIGATARYELTGSYGTINKALSDHYKKHFLDVSNVIGPNGYAPDMIHLNQAGYDAVAFAVYDKLRALGYI